MVGGVAGERYFFRTFGESQFEGYLPVCGDDIKAGCRTKTALKGG